MESEMCAAVTWIEICGYSAKEISYRVPLVTTKEMSICKLCVDNEATCICEGQRPVSEAKVNKLEAFIRSQFKKIRQAVRYLNIRSQ
jgi:hypothetical protein